MSNTINIGTRITNAHTNMINHIINDIIVTNIISKNKHDHNHNNTNINTDMNTSIIFISNTTTLLLLQAILQPMRAARTVASSLLKGTELECLQDVQKASTLTVEIISTMGACYMYNVINVAQ